MHRIGQGALALCAMLWFTAVEGVTTTVVDLPVSGGTVRFLDTYPAAPRATLLVLPGTPGTFEIQNDGSTTGTNVACNPVGSSRVDLQACKLEYSIVSPK